MVCIFGNINSVIDIAGAEVDGIQRLGADALGPLQIFVMADIVRNVLMPRQIQVRPALGYRPNGILPVPAGNKVAAGKPDCRDWSLSERVYIIAAKALVIRGGMFGIIHRPIDHRSDGLKE